jgi:hypothetical protein
MNIEIPDAFSHFVLRFAKTNELPETWAERVQAVFVAWLNETSEPVKTELLACLSELEHSSKKPGRVRKFFNGVLREVVKHLAKDPGGKSRYKWADKAYFMKQELKLDYEFIYPAVCQEATGSRYEELTECERRDFQEQCRSLVYQRRVEARKEQDKK